MDSFAYRFFTFFWVLNLYFLYFLLALILSFVIKTNYFLSPLYSAFLGSGFALFSYFFNGFVTKKTFAKLQAAHKYFFNNPKFKNKMKFFVVAQFLAISLISLFGLIIGLIINNLTGRVVFEPIFLLFGALLRNLGVVAGIIIFRVSDFKIKLKF